MRNEYGERLDRNGYAPSLLTNWGFCEWCMRADRALQRHEVYHGAYRKRSKELGCWVLLCDECHDRLHHHDAGMDRQLKGLMQYVAMKHYGWSVDDFRQRFGKSYVEEL